MSTESDIQGKIIGGVQYVTKEEADRMQNETTGPDGPTTTTALEAWADKAMFQAAPMQRDSEGNVTPKVYLLWMTPDPLGAIAAACRMYEGKPTYSMDDITDDERQHYAQQVQKTHLKAPLEFVKFHFFIEGVDRAFTHQLVRQRTAVYAQESHRFTVIGDLDHAVTLPPSLHGTPDVADVNSSERAERWRAKWNSCVDFIAKTYESLVNDGMPQEDARGLLPTATATRIHYITDLRNMIDHAGNRLCTQAQFHWRHVFNQMIKEIRNYGRPPLIDVTAMSDTFQRYAPGEHNEAFWQFEAIADSPFWRPVCYRLGHCPFQASFDRECIIRDRIEFLGTRGITGMKVEDPLYADTKVINPAEWMLLPDAAREA